jgi:hypothetical protein
MTQAILPQKRLFDQMESEGEMSDSLASTAPTVTKCPKSYAGQGVKWDQFEHPGCLFAKHYVQHHTPITYKGTKIKLVAETEEPCNFWACVYGSEFAE